MRTPTSIVGVLLALLMMLGLPGCGGGDSGDSGSPTAPSSQNRAPSCQLSVSPDGQAITGVTVMTFTASATDPDGDGVTYAWSFGDGSTGQVAAHTLGGAATTGETVTHIFGSPGTFEVSVTATDGRGGSTRATASITSRTLTGHWADADPRFWFEVTQVDQALSLVLHDPDIGPNLQGQGSVTDPRAVTFVLPAWFCYQLANMSFSGEVDANLDVISLEAESACDYGWTTFRLTRQ